MVFGYHIIISTYGFWLPNDPRGSWSLEVRSENLRVFGEATKVETHRSVARRPHDRRKRLAAKEAMNRPPVVFTGVQARAVAQGFGICGAKTVATIWACAVMPDHAHLVIARHKHDVEVFGNLLKGEATKKLVAEGVHPFQEQRLGHGKKHRVPPCFGRRWWAVYLNSEEDIQRTIRYVEDNPLKAGFAAQKWKFVTPYPERYEEPPSEIPPANAPNDAPENAPNDSPS